MVAIVILHPTLSNYLYILLCIRPCTFLFYDNWLYLVLFTCYMLYYCLKLILKILVAKLYRLLNAKCRFHIWKTSVKSAFLICLGIFSLYILLLMILLIFYSLVFFRSYNFFYFLKAKCLVFIYISLLILYFKYSWQFWLANCVYLFYTHTS